MITLAHHVEFLSDSWLAAARGFLARETAAEPLPAFSLCERFVAAPPHLGFPGDTACWSARFDGAHLTVSRAFDADADMIVEGDYQAALTGAQYVGLGEWDGQQGMFRDIAALYGRDAFTVRGGVEDARVGAVLTRLHDHMGRITVENPDLAHRAARQNMAAHIREMDERGFTVVKRAITPAFADELRAATLDALEARQRPALNRMLYQGRVFERLIQNPLLMTLVDASLSRGAVMSTFSSMRRGPSPGAIPLHTDYAHVPEPYPAFAMTGVGVWALEDWRTESGPTYIVPGSHKLRREPEPADSHPDGVPIEMPKGSLVFFTQGVWHWQGDRSQEGERVSLHMHFNRGILRSLEPKELDPAMLARNAPRLGELLGQDDWFDKMTATDRDDERFAHITQLQAFNDSRKAHILAGAD